MATAITRRDGETKILDIHFIDVLMWLEEEGFAVVYLNNNHIDDDHDLPTAHMVRLKDNLTVILDAMVPIELVQVRDD